MKKLRKKPIKPPKKTPVNQNRKRLLRMSKNKPLGRANHANHWGKTQNPVSPTNPAAAAASPAKKAASPAKKAVSPVKKAVSQVKKAVSQVKKAASPVKKVASPAKKVASLAKKAASPVKKAASPVRKVASPAKAKDRALAKEMEPANLGNLRKLNLNGWPARWTVWMRP